MEENEQMNNCEKPTSPCLWPQRIPNWLCIRLAYLFSETCVGSSDVAAQFHSGASFNLPAFCLRQALAWCCRRTVKKDKKRATNANTNLDRSCMDEHWALNKLGIRMLVYLANGWVGGWVGRVGGWVGRLGGRAGGWAGVWVGVRDSFNWVEQIHNLISCFSEDIDPIFIVFKTW